MHCVKRYALGTNRYGKHKQCNVPLYMEVVDKLRLYKTARQALPLFATDSLISKVLKEKRRVITKIRGFIK